MKLIIYNKSCKKKLNIYIKDYIQLSGRYRYYLKEKIIEISIEKKVKVFEGEYLNKKKNGKGKEYYYNGKIKFEREYLNGKRNGKGKEYNDNGTIKFEGEYLNDIKWNGEAEEYGYFNKLLFKGQYLDGKQNGTIYNYYKFEKFTQL